MKTIKYVNTLLTGDEKLIFNGEELPYTVKQYWQLNLSTLLLNMTRGGLAEFYVQCALDRSGFKCMEQIKNGVEPWDVDGPELRLPNGETRVSRIEVKSAASIQINTPDEKEPLSLPESQLNFSIGKKSTADDDTKRRNNDLYVFCHYKATRKTDDILNLNLWDFYVYPTFMIDENNSLAEQKTISLRRLHLLGIEPQSFDTLAMEINRTVSKVQERILHS